MGKQSTLLFYGLSIFVMLLYSTEVSGAAALSSILTVMKNDTKLCNTTVFLHESSYTKSCGQLEYPKDNSILNRRDLDIGLCLAVYDASYKLCHYFSHEQSQFHDAAAFDSELKKSFPGQSEDEKKKFCESIKNVKPMYEKTKPLLLPYMERLNNIYVCHASCFVLDEEFNPLCAILAWINTIDMKMNEKGSTISQSSTVLSGLAMKTEKIENRSNILMNKEALIPNTKETLPKEKINPIEQPNNEPINSEKKPFAHTDNVHAAKSNMQEKANMPQEVSSMAQEMTSKAQEASQPSNNETQSTLVVKSKTEMPKNQNSINVPNVPESGPSKVIPAGENKDPLSNKAKASNLVPVQPGKTSDAKNGSLKVSNEDVKTSTLSQNTQDKIPNEEDYRADNERIPFAQDEADEPADIGDLNQNIPEPSEQRDILPRYHSMRADDESHFFAYFTVLSLVCIAAYVGYHNKQKILAIVLEGRRSRNNRGRRRPSTASYRKLDCTLEEAVTSQCNANVTHVIY